MNKLDRIVIRAALNGLVEFDNELPNRFAMIGNVRFYKSISSGRWTLLFGHCTQDYGITLGWVAHVAMMIALRGHN